MFTLDKSGDLSGIAKEIERAAVQGQKDAGRAVAKEGRRVILDDVRSSRGSLRMMGGRLGVKQRVTASAASSVVELYASPAGPWTIVTKGHRSYDIRPRRRDVLAAGKGDVIGTRAHRRATTGRNYWGAAVSRLDGELGPLVERAVDAQMGRV